jgi:hypothetical protein
MPSGGFRQTRRAYIHIYYKKKKTDAFVSASKEIGVEVNAEKTKYMVMSRVQNAGQNENIQIGNKSFESVQ